MSNLIKSVYFNVDFDKKRVIDSDNNMEQYIPEIFQQQNADSSEKDFKPLALSVDDSGHEAIPVIHMDEEREKIADEMSEEIEKQVQDILDEANIQAQEIVATAQDDAGQIRENAKNEGIELGKKEGRALALEELKKQKQDLENEYQERVRLLEEERKQMEPFFADLTGELVEKITGVTVKEHRDVIAYLIERAVENLEKPRQVTIRVSKSDMTLISSKKNELKDIIGEINEFDILEDSSLKENQCIIETENKIIDCSLDVQLTTLREQLRMLSI